MARAGYHAAPGRTGGRASLTSRESMVLAMVLRNQPVTAYRIRQIFANSVVTNIANSTGTIYPIIHRLANGGYLAKAAVAGNNRGAELLSCTETGVAAIRDWVQRIDGEDLVLEDPVRSKMSHMDVLAPRERIDWLSALQAALTQRLTVLEDFGRANDHLPFIDLTQDNARSTLVGRLEWINRTLNRLELEQRVARAGDATAPEGPEPPISRD